MPGSPSTGAPSTTLPEPPRQSGLRGCPSRWPSASTSASERPVRADARARHRADSRDRAPALAERSEALKSGAQMLRPKLRALAASGLGLLTASAVAACGGGGSGLLSSGQAATLKNELEAIIAAKDRGQCSAAQQAASNFTSAVEHLGAGVNPKLRRSLTQGAQKLEGLAASQCQAQGASSTSTPPPPTTTSTTTTPATTATTPTTSTTPTTATTPSKPSTSTKTTPATGTTPAGSSSGGGKGGPSKNSRPASKGTGGSGGGSAVTQGAVTR